MTLGRMHTLMSTSCKARDRYASLIGQAADELEGLQGIAHGGEAGASSSQPMVLVPIVSRLPGGHTVVGEHSARLSGSQAWLRARFLLTSSCKSYMRQQS